MNKVILMGRLVSDPVIRYTVNNIPMARFRLAVNRPGKQQQGQPTADFIQITAWRGTAEFVNKYFRKGQQVLIEGYLRNNNWTDKDGNKRYSDDVHAEQVYFADSKKEDSVNNTPSNLDPAQQPLSGDGFYALNEDDEDLPF
jgi:single-strand DNA-binding protein